MPSGYYGTIVMAMFANRRYVRAAKAELKRRGLGPFRETPPNGESEGAAPRNSPHLAPA
jgi:hypothetical protein